MKKTCDGIAEIMMVGDQRKYNVALVTLKAVGANGEVPGTDNLDAGAKRLNPDVKTISEAMKDKKWIDAVTAAVASANSNGKVCFNNAAKIQKFTILPTNFAEENNELTPTKKLKRKVVEAQYKAIIEKMYSTDVYTDVYNRTFRTRTVFQHNTGVYIPYEELTKAEEATEAAEQPAKAKEAAKAAAEAAKAEEAAKTEEAANTVQEAAKEEATKAEKAEN